MAHQTHRPIGINARLNDVDQLAKLFGNWQGAFDQISAGRFDADLRAVRSPQLRAFAIQVNQRVRIRGADASGVVTVHLVSAASASSLWQGRSLRPGQLVLNFPETQLNYTSQRTTCQQSVAIRQEQLQESSRILLDREEPALPRGWAALSPPPAMWDRVERLLTRFVGIGPLATEFFATPEGRLLEDDLLRAVVDAVSADEVPCKALPLPARHRLIMQAEELMRSHLSDPLGAFELCRRLRVSDRTLRLSFRERYGMGPMGYYKWLRLNAVRSRLKRDRRCLVAEAAVAYGFHHLGNFAADYRRLFGEKPSETVR